MEGERSRDDRAKGFFEIRKISVFTKSIGSSRLWIEKPQNGVGIPPKEIRKVSSNKCKGRILRKTMAKKNRSVSQQDSNAPKDTIQKNPRK